MSLRSGVMIQNDGMGRYIINTQSIFAEYRIFVSPHQSPDLLTKLQTSRIGKESLISLISSVIEQLNNHLIFISCDDRLLVGLPQFDVISSPEIAINLFCSFAFGLDSEHVSVDPNACRCDPAVLIRDVSSGRNCTIDGICEGKHSRSVEVVYMIWPIVFQITLRIAG